MGRAALHCLLFFPTCIPACVGSSSVQCSWALCPVRCAGGNIWNGSFPSLRCSSAVHGADQARGSRAIENAQLALSVNRAFPSLPTSAPVQYKERVRPELIKPAVDWKKSGVSVATMSAAVAK